MGIFDYRNDPDIKALNDKHELEKNNRFGTKGGTSAKMAYSQGWINGAFESDHEPSDWITKNPTNVAAYEMGKRHVLEASTLRNKKIDEYFDKREKESNEEWNRIEQERRAAAARRPVYIVERPSFGIGSFLGGLFLGGLFFGD